MLETLVSIGWQSVKIGLLKLACFGIFTKLAFPASFLHGYSSVISHIRTENARRFFFFFGLKYLKFMHLLKEFLLCQHLQTVRDIFASHLQMPPLQENVDTVSLLPELNFENLNSIFINWSGLLFQTYNFITFYFYK